jgi:hypothetical protein
MNSEPAIQVNVEIMQAFVRLVLSPINDLNGAKRLSAEGRISAKFHG